MPESSLTNELLVLEHDVLKAIATGRSLPDAMTIICRRVEEMLPGVACSVLAVDRGTLRPLAGPSLPEAFNRAVDGYPIGPAAGSCGTAAYLGVEVDVADILTDPRWEDAREFVAGLGYTSCWSSPILARNGDTLGTFAFYYRERNGSRNVERDIVDSCVPLCAIAMEHERAQDTVRRLAYRDTLTLAVGASLDYLRRGRCTLARVKATIPRPSFQAHVPGPCPNPVSTSTTTPPRRFAPRLGRRCSPRSMRSATRRRSTPRAVPRASGSRPRVRRSPASSVAMRGA